MSSAVKFYSIATILKFFDNGIKNIQIPVEVFDADLKSFFLSKFFIDELRKFFTEKERAVLALQKKPIVHNIEPCE